MYISNFTFNLAVVALVATALLFFSLVIFLIRKIYKWKRNFNSLLRKQAPIKLIEKQAKEKINSKEIVERTYKKTLITFKNNILVDFSEKNSLINKKFGERLTTEVNRICENTFNSIKNNNLIAYPDNTRYILTIGDKTVILIEKPAGNRITYFTERALDNFDRKLINDSNFSHCEHSDNIYKFNLSFPYTLFLLEFGGHGRYLNDFRVFFKNSSIANLNDKVYYAPLLNCSKSGVCHGSYASHEQWELLRSGMGLKQICEEVIDLWMTTAFNSDQNASVFKSSPLSDIENWKKNSEKNPFWACKQKWSKKDQANLKDIIHNKLLFAASLQLECQKIISKLFYEIKNDLEKNINDLSPNKQLPDKQIPKDLEEALNKELQNATSEIIKKITL